VSNYTITRRDSSMWASLTALCYAPFGLLGSLVFFSFFLWQSACAQITHETMGQRLSSYTYEYDRAADHDDDNARVCITTYFDFKLSSPTVAETFDVPVDGRPLKKVACCWSNSACFSSKPASTLVRSMSQAMNNRNVSGVSANQY
jgi:hypothetical protein